MMQVIHKSVVARSLQRLRGQKTHPLFAGYFHLQQRAVELNRLTNLGPEFVKFYERFLLVKDHPIGTPYIKPFTDQRASDNNLWLNENVAGTYAPSSLRPGKPFRKVVEVTADRVYSLQSDHAQLALRHLLYNAPVSAEDLSVLLYRDFGFLENVRKIEDLVDCFAVDFGYASKLGGPRTREFDLLFHLDSAGQWPKIWLEVPLTDGGAHYANAAPRGIHLPMTAEPIQRLAADDLLGVSKKPRQEEPPIKELRIKGLLSFGDEVVFKFGRLNLLVGPNGSGKSNLIDCLRVFRESPIDIQSRFTRDGFDAWLYNGVDKESGRGEIQVVVNVPELSEAVRHQLRLGPTSRSGVPLEELVDSEQIDTEQTHPYFVGSYRRPAILSVPGANKRRRKKQLDAEGYNPFQSILSQVRDMGQYPEITRLANLYSKFRIYTERSFGRESELRRPASPARSDSQLSERMNDLPATLNALLQTPTHEEIKKLLPELKENYRDYVTRIVWGQVGLELVEAPFDLPIPAGRLSDGTLHFLALAAILLHPDPAPVICIDEPELGMHPDMIRMLADMIVEGSLKSQLIIATHSEHLLTALGDSFDILFAFDGGPSGTIVQHLSRQEYHRWRADHALGDLWNSGELGGVRY